MRGFSRSGIAALAVTALLVLAACGGNSNEPAEGSAQPAGGGSQQSAVKLSGMIEIDGSSTVFPITEGVAEEFGKLHSDVRVPVGVSGTGGGFKRFCAGETAISNASRTIKDSEAELCKQAGISYIELPIAYDGLSVLINPQNDWAETMTVAELHEMFKSGSTAVTWADVNPDWPKETIKIYSPGADSGTLDYFTEAINQKAQDSRNDSQITFSEDDNTLVQGIAGDKYAIGYFGYAYYEENQDKLKLVAVDNGSGGIAPSSETINNGTYAPLSRQIYIYVNEAELERAEVKEFVTFYLKNAAQIGTEVGYIELPPNMYTEGLAKLN